VTRIASRIAILGLSPLRVSPASAIALEIGFFVPIPARVGLMSA